MVLATQNTIEMIKNFKLALWAHAVCLHCYSSWWISWSGLKRSEAQGHGVALLLPEYLQGKAGWQWAGSILCSFWKREKQTDLHTVQSVDSNRDHMLLRRNVSSVLTNVPWVSRAERMKQLRRRRQTTEQTPIKGFLTAAHHPIGRFISRFYQPSELYDQTTGRLNQTRWGKNDFESTKLSQPLDCSWLSKLILPFWFSYSLLSSPAGKFLLLS